ncbi:MAG: C4-type zinc ribbon domain-containing protein, partial [Actinomycetota bacterium]
PAGMMASMADASDSGDTPLLSADDAPPSGADDTPPSGADRLLALQTVDSEIDQLRHRRAHLPEAATASEAASDVAAWERQRDRYAARIDELQQAIADADARSDSLGADKSRLEAQMKTVIAPREAEALLHEIATIDEQRDEIETAELEAMEEQGTIESALEEHLVRETSLRTRLAGAEQLASSAAAQIDAELAVLAERRDRALAEAPPGLVARYERLRAHHQVAAAALQGKRCTGCHLDLSAAEVDEAKDEAVRSDGVADCPQCGRLIVP